MVLSLDLAYLVLVDTTVNVVWGYPNGEIVRQTYEQSRCL